MLALRPRSILLSTDLSDTSEETMRVAAALAAWSGAELHVLHVYELASPRYGGTVSGSSFPDRIRAAERALDALVERAVSASWRAASRRVVVHAVERAILDLAEDVHADVIVLGPSGGSPRAGAVRPGVAERVARTARVPCLVVNRPFELPLRRVAIPLEPGRSTPVMLDYGVGWCAAFGAGSGDGLPPGTEVVVLHVLPPSAGLEGVRAVINRAYGAGERDTRIADARRGGPGRLPVTVVEEAIWAESAAEAILRFAAEESPDLTILAAKETLLFRRLIASDATAEVIRRAPSAVLVLPPALWRSDDGKGGVLGRSPGPLPAPRATA